MGNDNKKGTGDSALPDTRGRRIVGLSRDGMRVDNVTEKNRYDVSKTNPWLKIHLMSEDLAKVLAVVYIPRTREMPDVVMLGPNPFKVYNTRLDPPQYRDCMVATAQMKPTSKDDTNDEPRPD